MDVAYADTFAEGDFAGVWLLFACKNGEQSGFADSVGADQGNAVSIVNGEADVLKQGRGAEAFGDVLCVQDRRHSFSLGLVPSEPRGTPKAIAAGLVILRNLIGA